MRGAGVVRYAHTSWRARSVCAYGRERGPFMLFGIIINSRPRARTVLSLHAHTPQDTGRNIYLVRIILYYAEAGGKKNEKNEKKKNK